MAAGITNADNITLNLGSGGANVATDYLTTEGGHAQFVKLGIGGDGTLNQITSTNPLPVQLYSINPTFKLCLLAVEQMVRVSLFLQILPLEK